MWAKASEVLFDGELNAEAVETYWGLKLLRPDWVIMKGNKIVFLETDCGTHIFDTLKEKSELYKKFLDSGELQEMGFADISIVIQSYSRRIYAIKKNGCMDPIQENVKYLDFLDNEFNYMSQFWPSELGDPRAYRSLDRAVQKAKNEWENGMKLLWKKGLGKNFRDPIAFRNKVEELQRKGVGVEDLQDDLDAIPDFDPVIHEREKSVDLWLERKDSGE